MAYGLKGQYHASFSDQNMKSFSGIFQDYAVAKFKMASRSGGGHRVNSNNSGRKWILSNLKGAKKEWKRCHKHIYREGNVLKVQRRAQAAYHSPLHYIHVFVIMFCGTVLTRISDT